MALSELLFGDAPLKNILLKLFRVFYGTLRYLYRNLRSIHGRTRFN